MGERNEERKRYIARAKRRKRIFKRTLAVLITVVITTSLILGSVKLIRYIKGVYYNEGFIPAPYRAKVSPKVEKAKTLQPPDFVDVQLIHKHTTARTGIQLTDVKYVVVHYVGNPASTAQNNRDYFDKASTKVSSHFVVGLDGEIIQCVPLYEKSAASNERNKDSISIEVCHPDSTGEFNETTYNSLIRLVSWLCEEFSLDKTQIIRHYDITGKECPRYYVQNENEWENFKSDVEEMLNESKGKEK